MLTAILFMACVLEDGSSSNQSADDKPLTPKEFVAGAEADLWMNYRTVRFTVSHVTAEEMNYLDGTSKTEYRLYPQCPVGSVDLGKAVGSGFYAAISPSTAANFKRIGVHDISDHFQGKTVEFSGMLAATTFQYATGPTYLYFYMPVDSLDNVLAVSAEKQETVNFQRTVWESGFQWPTYPNTENRILAEGVAR